MVRPGASEAQRNACPRAPAGRFYPVPRGEFCDVAAAARRFRELGEIHRGGDLGGRAGRQGVNCRDCAALDAPTLARLAVAISSARVIPDGYTCSRHVGETRKPSYWVGNRL